MIQSGSGGMNVVSTNKQNKFFALLKTNFTILCLKLGWRHPNDVWQGDGFETPGAGRLFPTSTALRSAVLVLSMNKLIRCGCFVPVAGACLSAAAET